MGDHKVYVFSVAASTPFWLALYIFFGPAGSMVSGRCMWDKRYIRLNGEDFVSKINVIVATTSLDMMAQILAESVDQHPEMTLVDPTYFEAEDAHPEAKLVDGRFFEVDVVEKILESGTQPRPSAVVLVGDVNETYDLQRRWLAQRSDLVVLRVDVIGDVVRVGLKHPKLDELMNALRDLARSFGADETGTRFKHLSLCVHESQPFAKPSLPSGMPLLQAAIDWVHDVFEHAIESLPGDASGTHGFGTPRATVLQLLNSHYEPPDATILNDLLARNTNDEPAAILGRNLGLTPLEFRMMALALAPEIDLRYQQSIGILLDETHRRVGTLGLYGRLLGVTPRELAEIRRGALARWLIFDREPGAQATADDPVRIDPFIVQWMLGEENALLADPRLRRALRLERWPGASLLKTEREKKKGECLLEQINKPSFLVLGGPDSAGWRSLLELATTADDGLIRVDADRLKNLDLLEMEETARRVACLAKFQCKPIVIDLATTEFNGPADEGLRVFFARLAARKCGAALITRDDSAMAELLGSKPFTIINDDPLKEKALGEALREAANFAGVVLSPDEAANLTNRFPLGIDALELAGEIAVGRSRKSDNAAAKLEKFLTACKELVSRGVSDLVERVEPAYRLEEVILPPDRKQQLLEIVDQIKFSSYVLDKWKFGEKLAYGRGVAALFAGPSGTGKTMAAMGIANKLEIQILRIDLSKVVSKFIGETEKNIGRVFDDATASGAAILIDEAEALLGKRSEVRDAHDRYANIEVAYLLQRMEAFEGLSILTSNMRQSLDAAFMRRLRFIIDFPKPNAEAREAIWRQCLPEESYDLKNEDFSDLANRVELTGGQIRLVTLAAAFRAAADKKRLITLEDIDYAIRAELTKIGKPPIELVRASARRAA